MTKTEMIAAFNAAYDEYHSVPFRPAVDRKTAEYFYFSGSQFGLESGARIYSETFGRPSPLVEDDVEEGAGS